MQITHDLSSEVKNMEFNLEKDRTNVMLVKKALSQCSILVDSGSEESKIRYFLCPCGSVSTFENEKDKLFRIRSDPCNL